jgi:hypothetical protein
MVAILTGLRWNLSVDLIFISFMARDGEHFFPVCFFFFCYLSFLSRPSSLLLNRTGES